MNTYIYIIYIIYWYYGFGVVFLGNSENKKGFQKIQRELLGSSGIEWEILPGGFYHAGVFYAGKPNAIICHMPTIWGWLKSHPWQCGAPQL
jgi:hypothetical protein